MTRKHVLWLAPVTAAVISILAASAPGGATQEATQQATQEVTREATQETAPEAAPRAQQAAAQEDEHFVAQVDEWLCAIKKVADFGGYCAYYAIHCPTLAPRSWSNTNCNLSSGNCGAPLEPQCAKLPSAVKKKKEERAMLKQGHFIDPVLHSKGLTKPKPANFKPTTAAPEIKVIANHLVNLEDGGGQKLRVRLYQILVPKFGKHSQAVFGHGVEVESAGDAEFDIPYDERVVEFSERHCEVDLQGVLYSVILSTQPQLRRGGEIRPKDEADAGSPSKLLPAQNVSQPCCGAAPIPAPRLFRGRWR